MKNVTLFTYATFKDDIYFDTWHPNIAKLNIAPFSDWLVIDYYV